MNFVFAACSTFCAKSFNSFSSFSIFAMKRLGIESSFPLLFQYGKTISAPALLASSIAALQREDKKLLPEYKS
ncbi:MAG: hypothetical protein M1169_10235 [Firmicutes bacterium]|nr:hypothetical protein [Bacillota bacterium]